MVSLHVCPGLGELEGGCPRLVATSRVHAKSLQLCLTLCNPMDHSLPGLFHPWGFFRQEYYTQLPGPPPRDLPDPGIKLESLRSLVSPAMAGGFFTTSTTSEMFKPQFPHL